ncbi:hypothetical protein KR018_005956 [Drosophila ironensis]|nr:hypothetical protein KR018_005956 [Drosophila ironensis]
MVLLEVCLALLAIGVLLYKWGTSTFKAFDGRNIVYEKPVPFFGNTKSSAMQKKSFQKEMSEFYARNRQHKVVGFFNLRTPLIQLNDPGAIKKICVKDFDHFPNHQLFVQTNERLLNDMLSVMRDQRWKHMRNTLTPVFTAAKMRNMFSLMNDSFAECLQHLVKSSANEGAGGKGFEVDMKVLCNKLSNDLIATTAFGLKVNSFENPDNEFYGIGQSLVFSRGVQLFKFLFASLMPKVFNFFKLTIFESSKVEYFVRMVVDAIKYREQQGIYRPDMIQLLIEAKKESEDNWSDDEIVAQCFIFFFAAFENNANLICTTTYELLQNPDIQERLYEEAKEIQESLNGGALTYDAVQKMTYMDMVVSESLRKWTIAAVTDRSCSKDYILTDDEGNKVFDFKVGDRLMIPISGLHWDERFFPEPQNKVVGFFNLRTPLIQLNDPGAIKKICVKDFDHFPNHQLFVQTNERLLNDMLSVMRDQRWKHMRNTLTPVFTAAKMRNMFSLMNDSFAECLQHLVKSSANEGAGGRGFEVDMKVLCNKLSNDLIATTAFGLKVNSFENPDNEFYGIGQSLVFSRGVQLFKFLFASLMPKVFNFFKLTIFESSKVEYFVRMVVDAIKYREQQGIYRPDMIQLLIEAKKESEDNWSDDEIVAQCFIFFFAAFENNANLICTTTYELLQNPDIQERLYEEAKEIRESLNGGALTYDAVQKMTYMDMVVSESLRKWTIAAATDRSCSKDYTLTDDEGNKVFDFKVGDRLMIPISGLHWDERFFPEPQKFDPERFSEERKNDMVPYTYLPFGAGPRNCIGNRYALMQVKGILYNLLLQYKIEASPKTAKDLFDSARGFNLIPSKDFWMHLVPRK